MTTRSEWVCCCGAELDGSHDHNSCGPPEPRSTPITAEGLRGLGFEYITEGHYARCWRMLSPMGSNGKLTLVGFPHVWIASLSDGDDSWTLGDAPDLETVGRLIEVLRRMNGGGA